MKKNSPKFFLILVILFSYYGNKTNAQTGPGGVGSSSSNVLWLKSEDISLLSDGDDISSWADASGNENDVSQPNASFTPIYRTGVINGFPSVSFEKANGRIRRNPFTGFPTAAITAIYVNKKTGVLGGEGILSYAVSAANNNDFLLFGSDNLRFYRGGSNVSSGTAFNDQTFHITNASRLSTDGSVEIWKDGSRDYTGTLSSGTSTTSGGSFTIAGEQDSVDGNYQGTQAHLGDFTEVILFNTVLNQAQNIIVSNYLAAKYDLDISASSNERYAYEGTHPHKVAGIGRETVSDIHSAAMSDGILQIENASGIDADQEYLLFGHDDGDITTSWTTTEAPDAGINIQRLSREWRLDETGDVGTIDFVVDVATFPTLPLDHTMYALMVDSDGDFSADAKVYEITLVSGTEYTVTGIDFTDGDYIALAAVKPTIDHTLTSSSGLESSNVIVEINLNFIPVTAKTVEYTTIDGSAFAGSDYTAATGVTATILAGDTTANYTITITDDATLESPASETFTSTISSPTAGLFLGIKTLFTYTISDDDDPRKVYFDLDTANGNENVTSVTLDVSINLADGGSSTFVDYAVTPGSAEGSGVDFTLADGTIEFLPGTTTNSFIFTVNDDVLKEINETFTVTLSNPVNCSLDDPGAPLGTGFIIYTYTINDNDVNPEIQFTSTTSFGLESASPVEFEVNLSEVSGVDASATYMVTGTAISGTDFILADGIVTLLAGSTTVNITAFINDDSDTELLETMILTLSSPLVDATLGANTVHTYTINDDDTFGYTGPGGVGDSETNILWLDADKITGFADGVDLTTWSDVSGNSKNATEDATDSPIYIEDGGDGFPTVRFSNTKVGGDGDGTRITTNPFSDFATTAITSIHVNKNSDDGFGVLSYASSANNNDFLLFSSSVSNNLDIYRGVSRSTGITDLNDDNWHIVNSSWESFTGNLAVWKDGFETYNSTNFETGTSFTSGGSFAVGAEQDGTAPSVTFDADQAYDGDFSEVILYNVYLNDAQQIIVDNYLSAKYDITISNDFYTQDDGANGDFDFNVAGIGQAADASFHFDSQGNGIIRMYDPTLLDTNDYLFWGRNNKTAYSFVTNTDNYQERISTEWRISHQNDIGNVTFEVDFTGIDITGKQACTDFKLLVDNDSDFSSPITYTLTNTSGDIYQAIGVSFTDSDYFTIEYQDKIVVDDTTFYNGSGTSNVPDISDDCFKLLVKNTATGALSLTENANVREVEVEAGGILAVDTGFRLQVEKGIENNGEIRLVGTSQLLQTHATASQITGTGDLFKDQSAVTTTVFESGYWSSPVTEDGTDFFIDDVLKDGTVPTTAIATAGAAIDIDFTDTTVLDGDGSASPIEISGRWLAKLINAEEFTDQIDPEVEIFLPAEGWNMKSVGANFTFKGIPNDGIYTSDIDQDRFSLVGNPYPSAMDADLFIADNTSAFNGVLYFYNGSTDATHVRADYTGIYHTRVDGVGTPLGTTAISGANYYIPVGQAFFVGRDAVGTGTITFKNSQRVFENIGAESQFFSKSSKNRTAISKNKLPVLRLGFSFNVDASNIFKRELAIAFRGLTNNYEVGYDAEMFDKQPSDLALKVDNKTAPFVITGINHLDEYMQLPLELYLDKSREVSFNLDGLENMNATVYLEDAIEGISYNLSEGSQALSLSAGNYTDRFFISFIDRSALATENITLNKDLSLYYNQNLKEINIQTRNDAKITAIKIYNLLGQEFELAEFSKEFQQEITLDISHLSSAIYIVKLETNKGLFSKKIIKN